MSGFNCITHISEKPFCKNLFLLKVITPWKSNTNSWNYSNDSVWRFVFFYLTKIWTQQGTQKSKYFIFAEIQQTEKAEQEQEQVRGVNRWRLLKKFKLLLFRNKIKKVERLKKRLKRWIKKKFAAVSSQETWCSKITNSSEREEIWQYFLTKSGVEHNKSNDHCH